MPVLNGKTAGYAKQQYLSGKSRSGKEHLSRETLDGLFHDLMLYVDTLPGAWSNKLKAELHQRSTQLSAAAAKASVQQVQAGTTALHAEAQAISETAATLANMVKTHEQNTEQVNAQAGAATAAVDTMQAKSAAAGACKAVVPGCT